jgi:hypothetical protein
MPKCISELTHRQKKLEALINGKKKFKCDWILFMKLLVYITL